MKQNLIDKLIRERIAEMPEPPPRGWDALAQRLDPTAVTDKLLVERLATLSPIPPAGSWASLEQRLTEAEGAATESVDKAVSEALLQATPVTVSGWALLAARLELTGRRREMVACIKITEAVVLLSLLIVFFRFLSVEHTGAYARAYAGSDFPIAEGKPSSADLAASSEAVQLVAQEKTVRQFTRVTPPLSPQFAGSIDVKKRALPNLSVRRMDGISPSVATLSPEPLAGKPVVAPMLTPLPEIVVKPVNYGLSVFTSPIDVNQVVTQENKRLGTSKQSNFSTGFSSGLMLHVDQGKNGLETGLIYSYRSYTPAQILLIEGQYQKTESLGEEPIRFGRLRYRTVSIPLNYQRQLRQNDRWKISGGVGIAMNVILSSNFTLSEGRTEEDLRSAWDRYKKGSKVDPSGANFSKGRSSESAELDFFNPAQGAFEGGSLIKNSSLYLTGNVSFERLLNQRWSVYFAPTVSRLVTIRDKDGGKGPLGDRIHNTMLRFGARMRLTDK